MLEYAGLSRLSVRNPLLPGHGAVTVGAAFAPKLNAEAAMWAHRSLSRLRIVPQLGDQRDGSRQLGCATAGPIRRSWNSAHFECAWCKRTETPQRRHGPERKNELCNSCGLKFGRTRRMEKEQEKQRMQRAEIETSQTERAETFGSFNEISPLSDTATVMGRTFFSTL